MLDLKVKNLTEFAPDEELITEEKRIRLFSVAPQQVKLCPRDRDNELVLYVARGSGELFLDSYEDNDETIALQHESLVVIPSNIKFSLKNTGTETLMVLLIN